MVYKPELPPTALLHYKDFDLACSRLDGICEAMERAISAKLPYTLKEVAMADPSLLRFFLHEEVDGPYKAEWLRFKRGLPIGLHEVWQVPKSGCVLDEACRAGPEVFLAPPHVQYKYLSMCPSVTSRYKALFGTMPWDYDTAKRVIVKPFPKPVFMLERLLRDLPPPEKIASCKPSVKYVKSLNPLASLVYWARTRGVASIDNLLDSSSTLPVVLK